MRCYLSTVVSVVVAVFSHSVEAQEFPARPVRVVTSALGGSADLVARLIAQGLTASLGQQVIVDNRPTGIVPGETLVKAVPDGYTLLFHGSSLWMAPLMQKVPYDPVKDLAPISLAASTPNIVVVHPTVAAKSVKELIALAQAKPGTLNYGSGATGSSSHLAAELFKYMARVNVARVPYKGQGPAVIALLGGEVQISFATSGSVAGHLKSGKLRALGIATPKPSALAPGLPTVAESGLPGYQSASNAGMFAPARTPASLISLLNRHIVQALNKAEAKDVLFKDGTEVIASSPQEFAAAIKAEMTSLGKVIKAAGIREE
jgi:tripartite-type tricarboxylate transporter receptor subunit TctC